MAKKSTKNEADLTGASRDTSQGIQPDQATRMTEPAPHSSDQALPDEAAAQPAVPVIPSEPAATMTGDDQTPEAKPEPAPNGEVSAQAAVPDEQQSALSDNGAAEPGAIVLVGGSPEESAPARPGWLKRLLTFLFNPETKLGRFNRSALRWTAFVSGIFALGLLCAYLLLYRPAVEQLQAVTAAQERSQKALIQAQVDLLGTRQKIVLLETSEQTIRVELEQLQNRLILSQWINQTNAARAAVARREGAAAVNALRESRLLMEKIYPVLKNRNPGQADALKALVDLAQADLARDSRLVQEDLDRLLTELTTLNEQITPK